jgi:FKBP-type peptidyl-prolyl cis-trans isomerase
MGIYSRSLGIFIAIMLLANVDGIAQKRKKNKNKKKNKTEVQASYTRLDSVSYALGMAVAQNLKSSGVDTLNRDLFQKGLVTILNGDSTFIKEEEVKELLNRYFTELAEIKLKKNMDEGIAFLAKNKLRPEVDTTTSGLQYEVSNAGEGNKPNAVSKVTVNYEGKLLDGTIFDSSYKRGEPIQFGLGQVIPGWTEGIQLMSPGAKFILYIPSNLAYGPKGAGADIPPNSTLIFTVELISIDN